MSVTTFYTTEFIPMESPGRNSKDINFYIDEILGYIKTIVSPVQLKEIHVRPSETGCSVLLITEDCKTSTIQTWMLRMFLYKRFFEYYDIVQTTNEAEGEGRVYINPFIGKEYYHPYYSEKSVQDWLVNQIPDTLPKALCENPSLVCSNFTEDECQQEIDKYNKMVEKFLSLGEEDADYDVLDKKTSEYTSDNLEEVLFEEPEIYPEIYEELL